MSNSYTITDAPPAPVPAPAPAPEPSVVDVATTVSMGYGDAPADTSAGDGSGSEGEGGDGASAAETSSLAELQRRLDELSGVKDKFDALEQERQQQQTQATQAQLQQQQQAITKALEDRINEKVNNYGMPLAEAQAESKLLASGVEYQQKSAWLAQTVANNMAHQEAMNALGPNATVAQVQAFAKELLLHDSPLSMQQAARQLAPLWKTNLQAETANQQQQRRQQAIDQGVTRVEGGQRAGVPGGMGDQDFIRAWAEGTVPSTPANVQRAKELTNRGVWARAR